VDYSVCKQPKLVGMDVQTLGKLICVELDTTGRFNVFTRREESLLDDEDIFENVFPYSTCAQRTVP